MHLRLGCRGTGSEVQSLHESVCTSNAVMSHAAVMMDSELCRALCIANVMRAKHRGFHKSRNDNNWLLLFSPAQHQSTGLELFYAASSLFVCPSESPL